MTTGVFSEVFSPNRKVASDVRALLGQYETLQGDGDLLTTNQKKNLTVHMVTKNNKPFFKIPFSFNFIRFIDVMDQTL